MNLKLTFARAVLRTLAILPLALVRAVGSGIGFLLVLLPNRSRRIASINLALCFPELTDQQHSRLLRQRLCKLGSSALEFCHLWGSTAHGNLQRVKAVEGRDLVAAALADGNGVIILAPHLGNWEMIGLYLTECGAAVSSMYAPPKSPTLNQLILDARQTTGAQLVPANKSGVGQLLRQLRAGQMVGILPDQVPDAAGGVFAPFFGQPALTMTLMANLARKTGARIINAYALPVAGGYRVVFSAPDDGIYDADAEQAVAAMNRTVERAVAAHPEYYQWEYKRFKRQPEGRPSPYA